MRIDSRQMITLCNQFLKFYDSRLVEHGERVACIACKLMAQFEHREQLELKNVVLLALFHDIGAYKTEEIDRLLEFETVDAERHSIYGYLFLKNFTNLSALAQAVLYHHTPNSRLEGVSPVIRYYAQLIRLADRVDIALENKTAPEELIPRLRRLDFEPSCLKALEKAVSQGKVTASVAGEERERWEQEVLSSIPVSQQEALTYLKMMVHTIDFKSEATALHSTNTVIISCFLGEKLGLTQPQMESLSCAALIHDLGKAQVPNSILECAGRLSEGQMAVMRRHVEYTYEIIKDILPQDIVDIATRHHEKLDGSGYPNGLKAAQLTQSDRILAVADIVSALSSRRSYKDGYSWLRTLHILEDMANRGLIDREAAGVIGENYLELQAVIERQSKPILRRYQAIRTQYEGMLTGGVCRTR